jgi:hypothetical protein
VKTKVIEPYTITNESSEKAACFPMKEAVNEIFEVLGSTSIAFYENTIYLPYSHLQHRLIKMIEHSILVQYEI